MLLCHFRYIHLNQVCGAIEVALVKQDRMAMKPHLIWNLWTLLDHRRLGPIPFA